MDEEEPLLHEQDAEVQAPWEYASQLEQGSGSLELTVPQLLASRKGDVLRTLQRQGVSKLGEFTVPSHLASVAFQGRPLLTLGRTSRSVEFERVWRERLGDPPKPKDKSGWSSDVVVEAFVVNVKGAAEPDCHGLIQPLLRKHHEGTVGLQAFGLPAVQAVVEHKWAAFARRMLMGELCVFVVWLAAFFTFTDEPEDASLAELVGTRRGAATVAAELLALAAMTPFLVLEWGTMLAYGKGWVSLWNGLDAATYLLQLSISVLHLSRNVASGYLSIACALQCILLLFKLQYFSRVFTATRFDFLEAVKEAVKSISVYLAFMLLIVAGFAVSFHVLFRKDQEHEEFATITNAFLTMYANQGGLVDLKVMRDSDNPGTAVLLDVVWAFCMANVIMNLLIGLMTGALERTQQQQGMKAVLHKAEIVDELEATMPRWLEDRLGASAPFIHCLRIDPDRLDNPAAGLAEMWGQDGGGDTQALQSQLEAMQSQLDRVEALLAAALGCASGSARPAASASGSKAKA